MACNEIHSGSSNLSQNYVRVHFGLGTAARIDSLEIRWPSGRAETLKDLAADKVYSILEGQGIVPRERIRLAGASSSGKRSAEPDAPGGRSIDMESNLYREYLLVKSGKVREGQLGAPWIQNSVWSVEWKTRSRSCAIPI
jgi:hypothetical protein